MKKTKRIFSFMLAMVLVLSFSACKDKSKAPGGDTSKPTQSVSKGDNEMTESDLQNPPDFDAEPDSDPATGSSKTQATQNTATASKPTAAVGSAHTHKWQEATCTSPKTCTVCKATEGEKGNHKYSGGKCIYCNQAEPAVGYADYINYRGYNEALSGNKYKGALSNTYKKLASQKELTVVYFGGSVTYGYGSEDTNDYKGSWRVRTSNWLTKNFPRVKINNVNRAIGDTGTTLGRYRLNRDILSKKPDLLFIEFSINDYYEGLDYITASTQFETIVRTVKETLPECDIVAILVTEIDLVDAAHTTDDKKGELHLQAKAHEYICKKYNISSVHVGRALADKIYAVGGGVFSEEIWHQYVKDSVHPYNIGYEVYYNAIKEFLENALLSGECKGCEIVKQKLPKPVNLQLLQGNVTYMNEDDSNVTFTMNDGTTYSPDVASSSDRWADGGYKGIINFQPGSKDTITVKFTGTELVMVVLAPLSTNNMFEVSIDGGKTWMKRHYSRKNPISVLKGLPAKEYTAIIRPALNGQISVDHFFSRNG